MTDNQSSDNRKSWIRIRTAQRFGIASQRKSLLFAILLRPVFGLALLSISGLVATSLFSSSSAADSDLPKPQEKVILHVTGKISRTNDKGAAIFDRGTLEALGLTDVRTATPWTDGVVTFQGVLVRDLLSALGANGTRIKATALNDYSVTIPTEDFAKYDVIIATRIDGTPLSIRTKGPLWIIYPWDEHPELKTELYNSRSIWQLRSVVVD